MSASTWTISKLLMHVKEAADCPLIPIATPWAWRRGGREMEGGEEERGSLELSHYYGSLLIDSAWTFKEK